MTSFVVLQHDEEPNAKAAEKTVFVRDAFSVIALALPILWLLWNKLWMASFFALLLLFALGFFVEQNPVYFWVILIFNILLSLIVAIEGPALRMTSLRLLGYKNRGVIEAETHEDAQIIWALRDQKTKMPYKKQSKKPPMPNPQNNLIFGANGSN